MVLLDFSLLLSVHTARPTDILYTVNFIRFFVNTADSLTLMRVSFFSSTIVMVIADISTLLFLLSLVTDIVSSALPLLLADMMTVCIYPVALCTQ
jgi:hypothetical protein